VDESTPTLLDCERAPTPASARAVDAAQLLEAEIPFLKQAVRRWHRRGADADDLVQDTLQRALASAHLWEPGSNLRAWLVTIMRNQFLTGVVRNQHTTQLGDIINTLRDPYASENAEVRLTLRDVDRAIRRLPKKQRAAVQMAGFEGKSYSEIASTMGVSVDAVRCHLARARQGLRKAV
jgi:RNA polymerase sigma-70 factor (ECF subfamily)